jgi:hypothetical protein
VVAFDRNGWSPSTGICSCKDCGATFAIIPPRPLGAMRLDPEKATLCLSLLTEGCSIRSTERRAFTATP